VASSATFTIKVAAGSHAVGPASAAGGDAIEVKLASISDIQPGKIAWDIFGTHGVAAPTITLGGSPLGQTATFTLPAGDSQSYGVRCRVNGGSDVTDRAADTSTSAVYVPTPHGVAPFFIGETFEVDSTYGAVPRLNSAAAPIQRQTFLDVAVTATDLDLTEIALPDDSIIHVEFTIHAERRTTGGLSGHKYESIYEKRAGVLTYLAGSSTLNYTTGAGGLNSNPSVDGSNNMRLNWLAGATGTVDINVDVELRTAALNW
jgi:hypothetical protein